MKKCSTTYHISLRCREDEVYLYKSEEIQNHYSLYDGLEPCSGVLKHYGTKEELITELKELIDILEQA